MDHKHDQTWFLAMMSFIFKYGKILGVSRPTVMNPQIRIPTVKLKIPGKSRIQKFCYIQVIVFNLSYLPLAAVGTMNAVLLVDANISPLFNFYNNSCEIKNLVLKSRFGSLCSHLKPKANNFVRTLISLVFNISLLNSHMRLSFCRMKP